MHLYVTSLPSPLRNVPRRKARSFINTKNTGTKINTWIVEVIIPPTIGASIGFITSEPIPLAQRIGIKLARTAPTVIGIDGSVEIFDERGNGTGRQFSVQLKATDERDLRKGLAVQLKLDRCEYYNSLDLPVLIARFHNPTGRLFVKWFHEFDHFYSRRGKKTTTFRLAESDEWSDRTASKLLLDIERIRRLRSGNLPMPAPFHLHFHGDVVQGLSPAEISLSLRKALQRLPSVLSVTADASSAYGVISIADNTKRQPALYTVGRPMNMPAFQ